MCGLASNYLNAYGLRLVTGCDRWRHPVGDGQVDLPADRSQVRLPEEEDVRVAPRKSPAPHLAIGN